MANINSTDSIQFRQNILVPAPSTVGIGVTSPEAQLHVEHHSSTVATAILGEGYVSGDTGLTGVTLSNGGTGYTDGNYGIAVTGNPGSGSVSLSVSGGVIISATISAPGAGFASYSTLTQAACDLTPLGGGSGAAFTFTANFAGTAYGVKGVAAVGEASFVDTLSSIIAGSPENTEGDVIYNAIGLKVEDVTIGNTNWAVKTGAGTVALGDSVKNVAIPESQLAPSFTYYGDITVGLAGNGGPMDLFILGNYLYTANIADPSISVIDISIPSNPVQIAAVPITGDNPATAFYIYGQNQTLYVVSLGSSNGQLTAFDVSIPANPVQIGSVDVGGGANDVKIVGHYAYIVTFNANFQIINISDPTNMQIVGTVGGGGPIEFNGVDILGNFAYVVSQDVGGGHLFVFDITDPTSPTGVGTPLALGGQSWQIVISGRYAYVTLNSTNALATVDISNPLSPVLINTLSGLGVSPNGIAVTGRYAYVACSPGSTPSELDIIDISTATSIIIKTISSPNGAMSVAVSGPFVYVVDYQGDVLSTYYAQGIETTSITAHASKLGNLHVANHAEIRGELQIGRSLSVTNGIVSDGDVLVRGTIHAIRSTATTITPGNSSTPVFGFSANDIVTYVLTSDISPTITGYTTGQTVNITLVQDSTGGHAITWPGNVVGKPVVIDATANAVTTQEFICLDGINLNPINAYSPVRATAGAPVTPVAEVPATGSIGSGNNLLQFQAQVPGTSGNDIIINFDTSQVWANTVASIFVGHVLVIQLKNDGVSVLDTAATVASIVNGTSGFNAIVQVTNSPGSDPAYTEGINTATQIIMSGGSDAIIGNPAVGGDFRYTTTNLYVGQTDTTWKSVSIGPTTIQTVSDPSALNVDLSLGPIVIVNMNGSISFTAHNMVIAQRYTFVIVQFAGGDALGWDTNVFRGATAISGGTATGTAVQEFICLDGSTLTAISTGIQNINP